jgi:hypothetical protein
MTNEVTREDIERFYDRAAASGKFMRPFDAGELDTMDDRLAGRVVWREPQRNPERFITLTVAWRAVVLEASALRGVFVEVEPQTLRVVDVGSDRFAAARRRQHRDAARAGLSVRGA